VANDDGAVESFPSGLLVGVDPSSLEYGVTVLDESETAAHTVLRGRLPQAGECAQDDRSALLIVRDGEVQIRLDHGSRVRIARGEMASLSNAPATVGTSGRAEPLSDPDGNLNRFGSPM
jgi:hypothetical protein